MNESDFELAQRLADIQIEISLEGAKKAKALQPNGRCYNCGEKLPKFSGLRWCDGDCRDDWQKRKGVK